MSEKINVTKKVFKTEKEITLSSGEKVQVNVTFTYADTDTAYADTDHAARHQQLFSIHQTLT